jgi:hypothetical protein
MDNLQDKKSKNKKTQQDKLTDKNISDNTNE